MRNKLVAMMYSAMLTRDNDRLMYGEARLTLEELADYLISRGVTVQADVPDNNVGNKPKITVELKTTKIIASHLRKDFPFSANIIAAQIAHDLMAQGLLEDGG